MDTKQKRLGNYTSIGCQVAGKSQDSSNKFTTSSNKVADLSPIHVRKQSSTDGTYGSKYWFPGFGFDSEPNLQP